MNLEELKALAAKLRQPRIHPSEWMPRGTAFEIDLPVFGFLSRPSLGGVVETERVLICNADDYREAVARAVQCSDRRTRQPVPKVSETPGGEESPGHGP